MSVPRIPTESARALARENLGSNPHFAVAVLLQHAGFAGHLQACIRKEADDGSALLLPSHRTSCMSLLPCGSVGKTSRGAGCELLCLGRASFIETLGSFPSGDALNKNLHQQRSGLPCRYCVFVFFAPGRHWAGFLSGALCTGPEASLRHMWTPTSPPSNT